MSEYEDDQDSKADFVPPEQRKDDKAPLGVSEIEYLCRLCKAGEGLLMEGLIFSQAEELLAKGYARVKRTYRLSSKRGKHQMRLIVPTAKGRELARISGERKAS